MKRFIYLSLCILLIIGQPVYGSEGEMGQMGGISEGSNLPKTIEKYVTIPSKTTNTYQYKEVVFLSGKPLVFEGTITVALDDSTTATKTAGSYKEIYTVTATNSATEGKLTRTLAFVTYFRVIEGEFKKQIKTDSVLSSWKEELSVGESTYKLDPIGSSFSKTGVKDMTAGVTYFQTAIDYVAKYLDDGGNKVQLTATGSNYGYDQPWSKIETQDRDIIIDYAVNEKEDMSVKTSSTLEAKKTIYYDKTEPFPISFEGTYNQRMEREGLLTYQINSYHKSIPADQLSGQISLTTANHIEKLPIPENLDFIRGHWAEADFKKLYSMEVFTEIPHTGMQYEAMTRGSYIKALCLALNVDTSSYKKTSRRVVFGDVKASHPLYPYVMAAYDQKLIKGTGENFDVDRPINREEAFVVYVRIIGLERLGVTESPQTPFVDDKAISSCAKKEIMAGYKLGIIKGDSNGKVNPKQWISKAEAAAIVNRLIDYLRKDIGLDYRK
jgi:hypothetical protein